MGLNVKEECVIGGGEGREKKDGNLRDFGKQFFPSWHMEEFTEQAVTIGVESLC